MPRKYVYGEYSWNIQFQRGMKKIREGIRQFRINTNDATHIFRRMGDFVERKSTYRSSYGKPMTQYVYYSLRGRRVCPEHLVELVKTDWMGRKCPTDGCDYQPEGYTISTNYEDRPSEAIYNKAKEKEN
jgi:hypothetical protein